jgi:NADH-quinone oxidoreductase subunit G
MARMCAAQMAELDLVEGDTVLVKQDNGSAVLTVRLDNHVAKGCVRVAAAHEDTVGLGDLMGDITVEKIDVATLTQPLATAGVAA